MLSNEDKLRWDNYAAARLERYIIDKEDPIYNTKDILRKSKPGQYIWELLQNADDQGASEVSIELTRGYLLFSHNGTQFTFEQAKAISKVGYSEKSDQPKIGQFGTGFKSIYMYADRAEIHSGNLNFALEDYIKIVNNIEPRTKNTEDKHPTIFKIVFSNTKETIAFEETKRVLNQINDETMLFLNSLSSIEILFGKEKLHFFKQQEKNHIVKVSSTSQNNTFDTFWYLDRKSVVFDVFNGEGDVKYKREGNTSIAIKIQDTGKKIVPVAVDVAKIFAYFPLSNQQSNLKFHVHAPFVIDSERTMLDLGPRSIIENERLKVILEQQLASLVVRLFENESVGLDFLAILPNKTDQVAHEFVGFRKELIKKLSKLQFISIDKQKYSPYEVIHIDQEIQEQWNNDDLKLFNNVQNSKNRRVDQDKVSAVKIILPYSSTKRVNVFLHQIGVAEFTKDELKEFFEEVAFNLRDSSSEPGGTEIRALFLNWVSRKKVMQIRKLYILISQLNLPREKLASIPLFRTYDIEDSHKRLKEVYLASSSEQKDSDVILHDIFFGNAAESAEKMELMAFFEEYRIEEKSKWVVLESTIDRNDGKGIGTDSEEERLNYFLNLYLEDKKRFISVTREKIKLVGSDFKSENYWIAAEDIIASSRSVNFETLNKNNTNYDRYYTLWTGYQRFKNFSDMKPMLKDLGVSFGLSIVGNGVGRNVTFLKSILESNDEKLLKQVWKLLPEITYGDLFYYDRKRFSDTLLLVYLRDLEWVPTDSGQYLRPSDVSEANLREGFEVLDCPALSHIHFGQAALEELKFSKEKDEEAKRLGFGSAEKLALMQDLANQYSLDELRNLKKTARLEEKRQIDGIEKFSEESQLKEKIAPEISQSRELQGIRPTYAPAQEERKNWIKDLYGSPTGDVACQMCGRVRMPFKVSVDEFGVRWDFFETVALFTSFKKESTQNAVGLCPTCSAKMRYFRKTSKKMNDSELARSVTGLFNKISEDSSFPNSELYIEIEILGEPAVLKLNKEHISALNAVVKENQN